LQEAPAAVSVSFDQRDPWRADLVVGADGINSHVREILMGAEKPVYTGYVAHRAIFPSDRLGMTVASATKWWADDRYIMDYYLTSKRDEIYFVTVVPSEWQGATYGPQPADLGMQQGLHQPDTSDDRFVRRPGRNRYASPRSCGRSTGLHCRAGCSAA
jgi:6-hydroxynicotinate 3-monooxygenase